MILTTSSTGAAEGDTPTSIPTTVIPTVTPFVPDGGPPLQVSQNASVSQASPGDRFTFRLGVEVVSAQPVTIRVSDSIDNRLEVIAADASVGSCSAGQTVVCSVTAQSGQPATVTIQVRVREGAEGNVSNQASASVNGLTAASERVVVTLASPPTALPTSQPPTAAVPTAVPQQPTSPPAHVEAQPTERPDGSSESSEQQDVAEPPADPTQIAPPPTSEPPTQPSATPVVRQRAPVEQAPAVPTSVNPPDELYVPVDEVPF